MERNSNFYRNKAAPRSNDRSAGVIVEKGGYGAAPGRLSDLKPPPKTPGVGGVSPVVSVHSSSGAASRPADSTPSSSGGAAQ